MTVIDSISGREILDSRGNPTIEAEIKLAGGITAIASVPSGASTGSKEAVELRDNDPHRYNGKGVLTAVANINNIINKNIKNLDATNQLAIDELLINLDSTVNKSNLGANAILATSLAVAKAAAAARGVPLYKYINGLHGGNMSLPMPMVNVLNGGAHANNNIDIQEFMLIPVAATSFAEAMHISVSVFTQLKKILTTKGFSTAVGDEGGFAPSFADNKEILDVLCNAINVAGYTPNKDVKIALDCAASEFYREQKYHLNNIATPFASQQFVDYLAELASCYPIASIEDGLDESDWAGWSMLTSKLGDKLQIVGDDLFVTNKQILQEGINTNTANAILIKPNQIGTLSETLATIKLAQQNNYKVVISHRSGETEDTTIADLAVGSGAGQIKTGSVSRTDRVAKYNRLLRIEEYEGGNINFNVS